MPKKWTVSVKASDDLIEQLLINRKINTSEKREKFFHPKISDYENDLKIAGTTKAKKRILEAIERQELIIVYGDYDVDGLCAVAIMYHGLAFLGAKVLPYIPHREKEGYGLSTIGLEQAKEKEAKLIITVDNGIVAVKQARLAQDLGVDLIITDHHLPSKVLPQALAIVHNTNLSGAGVAWCLIREMVPENIVLELLDLVALATVCDLIPLLGVNRALVKIGLEEINMTKRVGLLALIIESNLTPGAVTAYDVGHILGPRLNAIGRLEHSLDALRLLCTKDLSKARDLAKTLSLANEQKKKLTTEAILEAKKLIQDKAGCLSDKKILVLSSKSWISGIIGLLAGRISEEYRMPAIIIAEGESISKGSARSVNGVNIVEIIRKCGDLLLDVGGHPGAAGFTLETAKLIDFQDRIEKLVKLHRFNTNDEVQIEALLSPKEFSSELVEKLSLFEPFGIGNPRPILGSCNLKLTDIKTVGEGKHLKFKLDGSRTDAIAFSLGNLASLLSDQTVVQLAYYLELNKFNGKEKVQLKVLDLQFNQLA